MRIILELAHRNNTVPFNYNYPLSSAIFNWMRLGDPDLSNLSHNNNKFKFSFSELMSPHFRTGKGGITFYSSNVKLVIASASSSVIHAIAKCIYEQPVLNLRYFGEAISFPIVSIVTMQRPFGSGSLKYQSISPVFIRKRLQDGQVKFLHPNEPDYIPMVEKILSVGFKNFTGKTTVFKVESLEKVRAKLLTLKNGYRAKCYHCKLTLNSSPEGHQFFYDNGLGNLRSQGLGLFDIIS